MFEFYNVLFLKVVTIIKMLNFYGFEVSQKLRFGMEQRDGHFLRAWYMLNTDSSLRLMYSKVLETSKSK